MWRCELLSPASIGNWNWKMICLTYLVHLNSRPRPLLQRAVITTLNIPYDHCMLKYEEKSKCETLIC